MTHETNGAKAPHFMLMNRAELRIATAAMWKRLNQYQLDHPCSLRKIARECGINERSFEGYISARYEYIRGTKLMKIDRWLKARGY